MIMFEEFAHATRLASPVTLFLLILLALPVFAEEGSALQGEKVYIVNDYRYDPVGSGGDPDTGHALCGTRCNAISVDYRNYIDPGGWRFIRVAENREVPLELNNPFIGGRCVCLADEYLVVVNDFNRPKQ